MYDPLGFIICSIPLIAFGITSTPSWMLNDYRQILKIVLRVLYCTSLWAMSAGTRRFIVSYEYKGERREIHIG